jgi:O-antigen/teichoic acid export membrane protein
MVVDRAADLLLVLYLARSIGVEDVGVYLTVISILYLFQNLVNYGLTQLGTREIARQTSQVSTLLIQLGLIGVGLGSLVTVALLVIIPFLGYPSNVSHSLAIVAFSLMPGALRGIAEAALYAVERMEHIAWVTGVGGLLRSGVSLMMLWAGLGLSNVFTILLVTQCLVALTYVVLIFKLYGTPSRQLRLNELSPLTRSSLVFSAMSIFLVGANNVDVFLLSKLGSIGEAGLYGAAFKLVQAVILLRPNLMNSLFPTLVQSASDIPKLRQITQHMLRLLVMLLIPFPIVFALLGKPLIHLLYGPQFEEAVLVLQILGWSIPLSYISVALQRVLIAANRENVALWLNIPTMLVNVGADILLIRVFGARGVAIASLISLSVAFLLAYGWVGRQLFHLSAIEIIGKPSLGLLLSVLPALFLEARLHFPPLLSVFVFLLSYSPSLILAKALTWGELQNLCATTLLHRITKHERESH